MNWLSTADLSQQAAGFANLLRLGQVSVYSNGDQVEIVVPNTGDAVAAARAGLSALTRCTDVGEPSVQGAKAGWKLNQGTFELADEMVRGLFPATGGLTVRTP